MITSRVSSSSAARSKSPAAARNALAARRRDLSVSYDKNERILRFSDHVEDFDLVLARTTLKLGALISPEAVAAMADYRRSVNPDAIERLNNYVPAIPAAHAAKIRDFVADAVILTLPQTVYTVEALVGPVTSFVYWAVFVVGCDLDAAIIFERELIETYVRDELPATHSDGTRRNHRAWVTRVAEAVNPDRNPRAPMPMNARSMEAPYTEGELVAVDRWSAGQRTAYLRENSAVLVALGIGAGLTSVEIAQLRAGAVTVHPDGMVEVNVRVKDEFKRRVIVTSVWERLLADHVADIEEDAFVFLPKRSRTENDVVSSFVARTSRPTGTPIINVRKMRNTWFVEQMINRTDVLTLMEAAGLQSLESISKLAKYVPRPSTTDRDAQLRGAL
ncbi:MAG: hypothetical protein H7201_08065 [Candidatus Saccharibacteria bacterium]|nr:hypothetical protein [Microbacteriaceae bacterium]